jgi:guanylate kinase
MVSKVARSSEGAIVFPIVVSGPSGVGKTTLCHGLMERDARLAFSISATTRKARATETHGKDYFFISRDRFEEMKARREFAEWAVVHDQLYGTPKAYLDQRMAEGLSVLLDIDVQGGVQVMERYPSAVSIFVVPPSFRVLEERLRGRKSESEQALRLRMQNAMGEMAYIARYAYVVPNDTVEAAVTKMQAIVGAERLKRERLLGGTSWREMVGLEGKLEEKLEGKLEGKGA